MPVQRGWFEPDAGSTIRRNGTVMRKAPLTTVRLGSRAQVTLTRATAVSGPVAIVGRRAEVVPFKGKSVAIRVHVRPSSRLISTCTVSFRPRLCSHVIRRSVPMPQFAPAAGEFSFIDGAPIAKTELFTSKADADPRLVTRNRPSRVNGP